MHGRARRFGGVIVGGLLAACWGVSAYGQGGNFDGFGNLIEAQAAPTAADAFSRQPPGRPADPFGPVPTDKLSLANAAPVLLPFFNNGPVFGLPGTVVGGFWNNTQLTGDWGGRRTDLARRGFFFDVYTTSAYQDLMSGGLDPGDWFVQNTQMSINIDTGRAGWWDGGLTHFTTQARYGGNPTQTFNSGATVPTYTGLLEPSPTDYSTMLPSEYFLVQGLSEHTSFLVGKISDIFIPDQTLFGDSNKFYFANFAFNKNPITTNFYNPTAWAVLGIWAPSKQLAFAGGVLDPNSHSSNLATNVFDKVNLYFTAWRRTTLPACRDSSPLHSTGRTSTRWISKTRSAASRPPRSRRPWGPCLAARTPPACRSTTRRTAAS